MAEVRRKSTRVHDGSFIEWITDDADTTRLIIDGESVIASRVLGVRLNNGGQRRSVSCTVDKDGKRIVSVRLSVGETTEIRFSLLEQFYGWPNLTRWTYGS